ncbi:MAG: tRNA-intron lyase [Candidatus Anstonellales archaeon]
MIEWKKEFYCSDAEEVTKLMNGFFGENRKGTVALSFYEALFLADIRNFKIFKDGKEVSVASMFEEGAKRGVLAKYFAFRDWRNRGLVALPEKEKKVGKARVVKTYRSSSLELPPVKLQGSFDTENFFVSCNDYEAGKQLYMSQWFGQLGMYKISHLGKNYVLDSYEALYLWKKGVLEVDGKKILKEGGKRIPYFDEIYRIYEEWRDRGYVVKTGFKFGSHFRIYMPGVNPSQEKEWIHSKHVLHVFPRKAALLASDWSRAIRVAHGVKKTFILAIPKEMKKPKNIKPHFMLYHRSGNVATNPKNGEPKFYLFAISEDSIITGDFLYSALEKCREDGVELLLAIVDRESSVTYYDIKRIELENGKNSYFEIEWLQP